MQHVDLQPADPSMVVERPVVEEAPPRVLYVRAQDIDRFGPSSGCAGCREWLRQVRAQIHSEACRRRITRELGGAGGGAHKGATHCMGGAQRKLMFIDIGKHISMSQ